MMTNDIALYIGGIGRLFLPSHLAMIAIMIVGIIVSVGQNQRMIVTINMVMRPRRSMCAAEQDSESQQNHGELAEH